MSLDFLNVFREFSKMRNVNDTIGLNNLVPKHPINVFSITAQNQLVIPQTTQAYDSYLSFPLHHYFLLCWQPVPQISHGQKFGVLCWTVRRHRGLASCGWLMAALCVFTKVWDLILGQSIQGVLIYGWNVKGLVTGFVIRRWRLDEKNKNKNSTYIKPLKSVFYTKLQDRQDWLEEHSDSDLLMLSLDTSYTAVLTQV